MTAMVEKINEIHEVIATFVRSAAQRIRGIVMTNGKIDNERRRGSLDQEDKTAQTRLAGEKIGGFNYAPMTERRYCRRARAENDGRDQQDAKPVGHEP